MSNSNPVMPKFDFSKASFNSEDALKASELAGGKKKESGGKVFRPGSHEVTISAATYEGLANDANWGKIYLTLKGAGEKEIRTNVLIPFKDQVFMGKSGKTLFPYNKLQNLVSALGKTLTTENLKSTMEEVFGNLSVLVGTNVVINVDYQKAHVKYAKGDGNDPRITICLKDKTELTNVATGEILTFTSPEAARAHMAANNIDSSDFPEVVSYSASSTPGLAAAASSKKTPW